MKKILTVSLFAMMAVSAANADIASTKYVTDRTGDTSTIVQIGEVTPENLTVAVNALKTFVEDEIATVDEGAGTLIDEMGNRVGALETALSATGDTGKAIAAAQAAADAAQQTADGKQGKSTADYQMGNKDGSWTVMTAAQQNALNSGVTSATVTQVATNQTNIAANAADIAALETALGTTGDTGKAITAAQDAADAAQAAADAAQQTADGKQGKSTADYQMGNKDGSWTAMTTAQQNALNSGVTSTTVTQVATNKSDIATKQGKSTADYQMGNKDGSWTAMTTAQQNALNSGVTSATVTQVATNATDIAALETALGTTGDTGKAITAAQAAADAAQDAADAAQQTADAAQNAADAAQQTADGKQGKSTADYQMGNKDGSWTAMTAAQQNALNSGVTSTTVTQVATNQSDIAAVKTNLGPLNVDIPDACATGTCSLVMKNGAVAWEVVSY